jgi:hypothetical protein
MLFALSGYQFPYTLMNRCLYLIRYLGDIREGKRGEEGEKRGEEGEEGEKRGRGGKREDGKKRGTGRGARGCTGPPCHGQNSDDFCILEGVKSSTQITNTLLK